MNIKERIREQLIDEQLSPNQIIFRDFIFGVMIMLVIIFIGSWIKGMIFGG